MNRPALHPLSVWVFWTLVTPLSLMAASVAVIASINIGQLPFDNGRLWWLGAVVPLAGVICLYGVYRRRAALSRFASPSIASLLAARVSPLRQALRAGLVVSALWLLVVAILGPRWGMHMEKQQVRGVDVVVALDLSRSMLARDLSPNRLEAAKQAIRQQLTERAVFRQAHRLGLLAFAGSTSLRVPLTTDHLNFRAKLDALQFGQVPGGGTAIARAIDAAVDLFVTSPPEATKVLLLFTDGEDHEGGPVEAAQRAYQEKGVRVFPVAVGDLERLAGSEVPSQPGDVKPLLHQGQIVFSRPDVAGLKKMAEAGGGHFAALRDLPQLVNAIAGMWKSELTTEERLRHTPRYQWFLAAALLLLGLETLTLDHRSGPVQLPRRAWQQPTGSMEGTTA